MLSPQGSLPITQGGTISFKGGMVPPITTTLTLPGPTDSSSTSATTGSSSGSNESSGSSGSTASPGTGSGSGSGPGASTVTVTSPQSPGGSNPTAIAAGSAGDNNGSELSTGAKAGIGAGAGVAGLALIVAIIFFLMRSARRSRQSWSGNQQAETYGGDPHQGHAVTKFEGGDYGSNRVSAMTGISAAGTPATGTTISEVESRAARPWSLRSELDTTGPAARMVGTSPSPGMYTDGQHAQPQHYGYGNAPGMQHGQNWAQPYPTNNQMGPVGVAMSPEAHQGPAHGGNLAPVHELA